MTNETSNEQSAGEPATGHAHADRVVAERVSRDPAVPGYMPGPMDPAPGACRAHRAMRQIEPTRDQCLRLLRGFATLAPHDVSDSAYVLAPVHLLRRAHQLCTTDECEQREQLSVLRADRDELEAALLEIAKGDSPLNTASMMSERARRAVD